MGVFQGKNKRNFKGLNMNTAKKRQNKEDERARKLARNAVVTVIVVAVLFVGALFINSDYLRQEFAAVRIGSVKYSVTDFNYYYQNLYQQYYSSLSGSGELASAMLPEQGQSLKSQIYDEETGETWADFFKEMTLEQMKEDNKILVEALAADYELTEEDNATIEEELESIRAMAYNYGYPDLDGYLKAAYGKGMDEDAFREALERAHVVVSYSNYVNDSFTYTADELESFYTENQDKMDTFTYRYFHISIEDVNKSDYEEEADYDAAKEAAIDETEEQAKAYAAGITDEAGFIEAARDYDPETNAEDSATLRNYQGELLGSTYGDWLKDAGRAEGDVSTFRSTNGTYVVYYISRSDNHYNTVNARMILCPPETVNAEDYAEDETTEAYDAAVEAARQAAEDTAGDILTYLETNGGTEDAFIDQTEFYAGTIQVDDEQSGLFEEIYNGQMAGEVNDWLFDASRAAGDYELIYSEDIGYYLVYFVSTGDLYSNILADEDLRVDDLQAWKDSLEVLEPTSTWLMTLTV